MSDQPSPRALLAESLIDLIKKHGTQEFGEAKKWFTKAGMQKAEEGLIIKIAEALADSLSDGLIQLSVEQVTKTEQYQGALQKGNRELVLGLSRKLPPMSAYVEFVIRYGSAEIATIKYEFRVESQVEAKNIKVVVENNRISYVSFGTVAATLTLSVSVNQVEVNLGSIERDLNLEYRLNMPRETGPETETETRPEPSSQPINVIDTTRKCVNCGSEIEPSAYFCNVCGAKQD